MKMLIAAICMTLLLGSNIECVAQQPKPMRAILPPDCNLQLSDGSIYFSELEIADGCVITFSPSVKQAEIVVDTLTLDGKSTINLSPQYAIASAPPKPPTPPQAGNNPPSQAGGNGASGGNGQPGESGISLKLTVRTLVATDGSLWIRTDGGPGSPGGPGGDGAKGAGPLTSGTHCYDGGAGGNGGSGGIGGRGGNTSKVEITIKGKAFPANLTPGVAPSAMPQSLSIPSTVIAAGSPGPGGAAGSPGGNGGPGGEGRSCHFPASDANPGPGGHNGPSGSPGQPGSFVP